MNRSKRMEPIAKLAGQHKQNAAHQLGEARQKASNEDARLKELINYKQEYLAEFQRKGRAGVAGLALRQFQFFVAQLDKAIHQQRERIKGAESNVEQNINNYRLRAGKSQALDNAVDQMRQAETRARDKSEQKLLDELSARQFQLASKK